MKKAALIVGVEDYQDKRITPLRFARADALGLAERLQGRCGFDHIRVLADAEGPHAPELGNILDALTDLAGDLRPEDLFLFFFSGHGVEIDGRGYLLTRDSRLAFPEHASLPMDVLARTFGRFRAGRRVILLDCCRNSPEAGKGDAANCMGELISKDIVAAARNAPDAAAATVLLTACRPGQRAYEWPTHGHGVFTHYLLAGLDGAAWKPDGLRFAELAEYTYAQVRQWSEGTPGLGGMQEPWYEQFGAPFRS